MKVIIIGDNRAQICKIPIKHEGKDFFKHRNQLYKTYPHAWIRCRNIIEGIEKESDEILVFPENVPVPYHTKGIPYDQDTILAEIDEHKHTCKGHFSKFYATASKVYGAIVPYLGLIIAGLVVVYAFISQAIQ